MNIIAENRPSLGMPALLELNLEECVTLAESLGLDFIELNMNMPAYLPGNLDERTLDDCRKRGIYFTMHLDEPLNPFDFNARIADAYLEVVLDAIRFAKRHDMPVLNMHLPGGVHLTMPDEKVYLFERYKEHYFDRLLRFRDLCEKSAGQIKICVENTGGYREYQKEAINLLLQSETFALTLDIGHDHAAGNPDEAFILSHKQRLVHMHLHDAKGKQNHLVIGTGEIDIAEKLRLAKSLGCRCVVETKTVEGLTLSIQNLYNMQII